MKTTYFFLFFLILSLLIACKSGENISLKNREILKRNYLTSNQYSEVFEDTIFVNIKDFSTDFVLDMKYATPDNFLKQQVYDCEQCFLRFKTVQYLIEANNEFLKKGYRIKLLDCYRPLDVQKKMWDIMPNPDYVANPQKGSIHNRGGAVDITLVDKHGVELNMGTPFDHFGIEAAHDYQELPKEVLENRLLLKKIMTQHHFKPFDSEWWHYNLIDGNQEKIANFKWNCN